MSVRCFHHRLLLVQGAVSAILLMATPIAQQPKTPRPRPVRWTAPHTPWGDPDLQGIYTNKDENNTPFERPAELAGKHLSDFGPAEMAALVKQRQETAAKQ